MNVYKIISIIIRTGYAKIFVLRQNIWILPPILNLTRALKKQKQKTLFIIS